MTPDTLTPSLVKPNPALTGQSSFIRGCITCGQSTQHPEDRAILRCEYHAHAIIVAEKVLMAANEPPIISGQAAQATETQTGQNVRVEGSGPARWVLEGFR